MRLYITTIATPPVIATELGSQFAIESVAMKRRDAGNTQIQFFDSYAAPVGIALDGTPEISFGGKESGDWNGPGVVLGQDFTWNAKLKLYESRVSFNTHGLTALFVGMTDHVVITADTTLDATHLSQLVVVNSASSKTIKVGASLGSAAETMVVQRAGAGAVVLQGDTGVTVTAGTGVTLSALSANQCIKLTRTGANAWTATIASEVDSVTLMAEITWRDAEVENSDQSTKTFDLVIENDVIRRDESAPTDANAPTIYTTKADLAAEVTTQINAQIGGPAGGAIPDNTGATLRGEVTQVQVAAGMFGGFRLSRLKDTFTGSDLQHDVCTIEADTLGEGAVIDFLVEGSRFQVNGAGGYRNAITIDAAEVFTFTRNEIDAFDDQRVAYRLRGQIIITATGASGKASISWDLTERAGSTTVSTDSLPASASSTDATAITIDTTTDFDLGLAAAYTVADGQRDHCITRAYMRRIL